MFNVKSAACLACLFASAAQAAGIERAWLGDAESGTPTDFTDNTATGFGVTIGFRF